MSKHMNMSEGIDIPEDVDIERKRASIRTALFVLACSLILQVTHYLWQA